MMDCTNIDYEDNVFDTIVDTFGLQANYDYRKQFEEMKRVCKVKIFYFLCNNIGRGENSTTGDWPVIMEIDKLLYNQKRR